MKRIKLWLREFSLTQQLMVIVFLVVVSIAIIYLFPVTSNVNEFVNNTIYGQLSGVNQAVASGAATTNTNFVVDSNFSIVRYNPVTNVANVFQGSQSDINEDLVKRIIHRVMNAINSEGTLLNTEVADQIKENKTSIYFVGQCESEFSCTITMVSNAYQEEYKSALVNSTVLTIFSMTAMILVVLFLWVSNIIHPLAQMRKYVTGIRNGQPVDKHLLTLNRYDEIGDLANALGEMKEYIDRQDEVKAEMVQNISHDLKTPIATIKSYAESIKDGIYPYGTLEDSVDVIIEHASRLEKKVHSLLLMNRVEYLKDTAESGETVEMHALIERVSEQLAIVYPNIDWAVEADQSKFHGDSESWRIVIENLCENATRYAKTQIKISLKRGVLAISNDGPRIDDDKLQTIFRPYEVGNKGQFGLGLSIVRKVCDTYGYNVCAENLSNGVVFKIQSKGKQKVSFFKKETNDKKNADKAKQDV